MMDYLTDFKLPVELASPVEFMLVGTFGNERGVLVQSIGASVDLIAYTQNETVVYSRPSLFSWLITQTGPIATKVDGGMPHIVSKESDNRATEMSFVWRGERGAQHLDEEFCSQLRSCLTRHSEALFNSLHRGSESGVTWETSEMLALCKEHEESKRRRRLLRRGIFGFTFIAYLVAGSIALLFSYANSIF